jgi:hypothetical protein
MCPSTRAMSTYSLEHLRDLTMTDLHTTEAQNGHYFDKTLRKLFRLIAQGNTIAKQTLTGAGSGIATVNAFELAPLDSQLFDPASTPLLNQEQREGHLHQRRGPPAAASLPQRHLIWRDRRGRPPQAGPGALVLLPALQRQLLGGRPTAGVSC